MNTYRCSSNVKDFKGIKNLDWSRHLMPKFHQLHHLVEITAPVLTAIDFLHVTFMHACMLALVYIGVIWKLEPMRMRESFIAQFSTKFWSLRVSTYYGDCRTPNKVNEFHLYQVHFQITIIEYNYSRIQYNTINNNTINRNRLRSTCNYYHQEYDYKSIQTYLW